MIMKLRLYLNRKGLTYSEAGDIPKYVLDYLRPHRRSLTMKPLQTTAADAPETRGRTS